MEAREDCVKMVRGLETPFLIVKCRGGADYQLMNIFDTDRSGSINFMEFEGLYRYIKVSVLSLMGTKC